MNTWEEYNQNSEFTKTEAADYLRDYSHLLKWKSPKETIIEFGCGDGYITRKILYPYIEKHLEKLIAVDLSEIQIQQAKNNNDVKNIQFEVMDMNDSKSTEGMNEKFDHIFSFYCMHYVVNQRFFVKRLYDMLKPGGQLFVTVITQALMYDTIKKQQNSVMWSKYLPKASPYATYTDNPEQYMRNLLKEAGFQVELCKEKSIVNTSPDVKAFARGLVGMSPFLKFVPVELQEVFIEEYIQAFCQDSIKLGGLNKLCYVSMIYVATKNV